MRRTGAARLSLFLLFSVFLCLLDQVTKRLASTYLSGGRRVDLVKGVLQFLYIENRGAAFGILYGQQWLFVLLTIPVLLLLLYTVCSMPQDRKYLPLMLVCLLVFSGAVGNFIDRLFRSYVVDFIYFMPIDFPVFNVADIMVTIGCFSMALLYLLYYKEEDFYFLKFQKSGKASQDAGKEGEEGADA